MSEERDERDPERDERPVHAGEFPATAPPQAPDGPVPPPEGPDPLPAPDEPDEDPLPDAPLFALLRTIADAVEVDRIDRVWIFPPRRLDAGETALVVVAAYPEVAEDRRRVYAAHYTAPADAPEPRLALHEYGTAPTERIGRLVEDVVERLKDEPASPPRNARIEGDEGRWNEMLYGLAAEHLERAAEEGRRRGGR